MRVGLFRPSSVSAQGLGGAGTLQGIVKDPTGGVMQAVEVRLANPVSGFMRSATTDATGKYPFNNLPPNAYHVTVMVQGFKPLVSDVDVRTAVPITLDLTLTLEAATTEISVVGHAEDLVERDPSAHTDLDQSLIAKMLVESSAGLNQVVTLASPGVVSHSNGFFHPVGDHAQTQFSIDNQPVTDQQSRLYSNQISQDAVQSMEIITGIAPAEYGDKTSLVVHIVTKSGLDQPKPTDSASISYSSFKTPTGEVNFGGGGPVSRSAGIPGASRRWTSAVRVRSAGPSREQYGHIPSQCAGRAFRLHRAEHARCRGEIETARQQLRDLRRPK